MGKCEVLASVGVKQSRRCPLQDKDVECDGLCKVILARVGEAGSDVVMCPVFVDAFDKAVNC